MQSIKKMARDCYAVIENSTGKIIAIGASTLAVSNNALAAVPAAVTTALSDGLADATTVAGAALIIVVGVAVFKYMRRAL